MQLRAAQMAATLVHRGPDDAGSWADPTGVVGFGFQRLSIIDLSPAGHQPMTSADGRHTVVFNGEIYNFPALREALESAGHAFRGRSDTEVLLAAVSRWGIEATLPRIWGMFAFAMWDAHDRVLHLVRDRLGKKPLYYGWQGDDFLFGSELKALRAHPSFSATIDRAALASFMRFSYVPAPRSIYDGIRKLPPASWVTIDPERPGDSPVPVCYWDATAVAHAGLADPLRLSDEAAIEELDALLADAVQVRAIADVPLGAFLSGGIDSSAVVALLQRQSSVQVSTFTIGFDDSQYDESARAKAVARHLGTNHTELLVTPEETQSVIPRLPSLYDEPFADSSQIPTFLVSQLARRSVTVALSGDGGDEVFGGYNRYVTAPQLWRRLAGMPLPLRRGTARLAEAVPPAVWDRAGTGLDRMLPSSRRGLVSGNRVHKLATVLDLGSIDEMYTRLVSTWPEPTKVVMGSTEPARPWDRIAAPPRSAVDRMMLFDLLGYLPDDILVKVDRASMGTSLEARTPFLDHRVVEFAWRLPASMKIRDGVSKWLLRRVLARYVPPVLVDRLKHGFGVPIDVWLRGPLRGWAQDLLAADRLRREGYLDPILVQAALRDHLSGHRNRQHELWAVLMFEAWLETQVAGAAA